MSEIVRYCWERPGFPGYPVIGRTFVEDPYDDFGAVQRWLTKNAMVRKPDGKLEQRRVICEIDMSEQLLEFARWCCWQVLHLWPTLPIVRKFLHAGDAKYVEGARALASPVAKPEHPIPFQYHVASAVMALMRDDLPPGWIAKMAASDAKSAVEAALVPVGIGHAAMVAVERSLDDKFRRKLNKLVDRAFTVEGEKHE